MNKFVRIKIFLACLWLSLTATAQNLQPALDKIASDKFFQEACAGIAVYDLTDRQLLYNYMPSRLCRPASNLKLLTAAAALHFLGADYLFKTQIAYTGTIDSTACLHGNLYITGGFDPELTADNLDSMLVMLRRAGIRRIEGTLYACVPQGVSEWGKGWSWDDDQEAFQPYLSPLMLNKGVDSLAISPGKTGEQAVVEARPATEFVQIVNKATTVNRTGLPTKKTLHFKRSFDGQRNTIEITGEIAAKAATYRTQISLRAPIMYILTVMSEKLRNMFRESAIKVGGEASLPPDATVACAFSHSVAEVITRMNKESDNLNAEMLLYALGMGDSSSTDISRGIAKVQELIRLSGCDPARYSIVDGSGLSHLNYLSPEVLLAVLRFMYREPSFQIFMSSLPEAAGDGTLKLRLTGKSTAGKVFAKTGSLSGISTMSGYITAANGHLIAFSIMIQNFVKKSYEVHVNYLDKICEKIITSIPAESKH